MANGVAGDVSDASDRTWILRGMRQVLSPPALILVTAHLGFAGLARDAGVDWLEASFMVGAIWALPANLILLGAITAGSSLAATALAVGLSSLRLMPMVLALLPEMRAPRTRTSTLFVLSHFIAITAWVVAMEKLSTIPRDKRTAYFGGFAVTLCTINVIAVAFAFNLMGQLPAIATGALAFFTPVYFLTSLFGSARDLSGRLALLTGMLAVPPANWLAPEFDILIAGIVGGAVAFGMGRWIGRRRDVR
ncbi:AzlC family ABC transporter permease [Aureimonas jatrophae]|uniref:Predicted branched-chain amino acid permease (Azaleucine resistance) n=1 Tax=Aureimonas jatrophae TaxID=1166073 RepID=A0A1H0GW23_9HYPH|nr:AzlC family ABC transporter permease [Aureimonas jatrophae]MBB3949823.1 putative branched-subunit amino acid permease [Aureimonas jatrophae]SDO11059.1 Predicted branched-chain amino acid permease (azaleucine resistance) [Aureimonas jatrophae]